MQAARAVADWAGRLLVRSRSGCLLLSQGQDALASSGACLPPGSKGEYCQSACKRLARWYLMGGLRPNWNGVVLTYRHTCGLPAFSLMTRSSSRWTIPPTPPDAGNPGVAALIPDTRIHQETHLAYFDAGADVAISASYQASNAGFAKIGVSSERANELMRSSVELARRAADRWWSANGSTAALEGRRRPLVAASVGCYGATLADGSEYRGDYSLSVEQLKDFHRPRILALAEEPCPPQSSHRTPIPDSAVPFAPRASWPARLTARRAPSRRAPTCWHWKRSRASRRRRRC